MFKKDENKNELYRLLYKRMYYSTMNYKGEVNGLQPTGSILLNPALVE